MADIVSVVQATVPVRVLRVDGGLTRDPNLLQLQANAAGVTVQRGLLDATVAGAAALAAVGAGLWDSTRSRSRRGCLPESAPTPGAITSRAPPPTRTGARSWSAPRRSDQPKEPAEDVLGALDVFADQPDRVDRVAAPQQVHEPPVLLVGVLSTSGGCAIRVISSLMRPCTSVIALTRRGEAAASASPM